MTFTKEQLQHIIETDHVQCGDASALARMALAGMEAEPVAWAHRLINKRNGVVHPWVYGSAEACPSEGDIFNIEVMPLYTAPPAPVSVPDERYQHLSELYHAQEKRLFKLAQRIKGASFDKYAYSPSQAIDVLESAIFGEREDECRAAILHGADRPQNEPQNIPENIPATQFEPVADLYGLTSPTGGETSFTFDAVEARDFIDGGWSCQEYVELGRYQEALTDHSEDKLAMVDHSGDSNNMVEPVTTTYKLPFEQWLSKQTGTIDVEYGCVMTEVFFHWLRVAYDAGNSPVIPDDVRRMDWLVSKTVDVREPMVYGSHSLFWSQTITDEEDDYHATKLREQIDAAMAAEQAAAPQQEAE
ncbi:hypothetical protein QOM24_25570 (plasmid) [Enterobacter asburiae]|nr:hypothetical protein [Enterobacter asburiae]WKE11772.1 hypothetical protein QOM24_25570 [Enterobacter asburiae]